MLVYVSNWPANTPFYLIDPTSSGDDDDDDDDSGGDDDDGGGGKGEGKNGKGGKGGSSSSSSSSEGECVFDVCFLVHEYVPELTYCIRNATGRQR
jgi:hypothetical protein